MNIGIILAAGKGERFGGETEKQFCYSICILTNMHICLSTKQKSIDDIWIYF